MQNPPTKSRVNLGFYLSIISLFAALIPLAGYPVSIIAIIMNISIIKIDPTKKSTTGTLLSIIGLTLTIINSILSLMFVNSLTMLI